MAVRTDLWKAYAHLYPNANPRTDYRLEDDGSGPRCVFLNPALGAPPTEAQEDAAIAAYDAAKTAADQDAATLRGAVLTTAQSAVGIAFGSLTAAQVRALLAIVLHKEGALDKSGVVRPLADWVR